MRMFLLIVAFAVFMAGVSKTHAVVRTVGPDARPGDLTHGLQASSDGDTIHVRGGRFDGPLTIDRSVTLLGSEWPAIDGGGTGTVVTVTAPYVTIKGCVIRNSGILLEAENAGITILAGHTAIVGNRIEDVLFGVYLREADSCRVAENRIVGHAALRASRRGDLIRAWYSNYTLIENNVLEQGRDLIVWFSNHSIVRGNTVSNARYGVHLMYDRECRVSKNMFLHNSVGAYLMYSRGIIVESNTMAYNRGPSGFGVGLKDLDDARVINNFIVDNRVGVFVDNSPRDIDSHLEYESNVIAYNDEGMRLNASTERTRLSGNTFMENYENILVPGGNRAPNVTWIGNYWSDYAGYDADGDGIGEIPYHSEELFEDLIARNPKLRVFIYSPAIQAFSLAAKVFPVVRPRPRLSDEAPIMRPQFPSDAPAPKKRRATGLGVMSFMLVGIGVALGFGARIGSRLPARIRDDRGDIG